MENIKSLFFDYASTTPVEAPVFEAMIPWFNLFFGNPSSRTHEYGWKAENAIKTSRETVAELIGAEPDNLIFTSGSTEGINFVLKGLVAASKIASPHVITCKTEHKAVLDVCKYLETKDVRVTYLSTNEHGIVDLNEFKNAICADTIVTCIMHTNNETGVVQPIEEIGKICQATSSLFMTDATQAVGKTPIDVNQLNVDLLVLSGHKFGGPKGVGCVYIKEKYPRIQLEPLIHGGGHEFGYRSGTLNVPAIVGIGKAAELAPDNMKRYSRLQQYKDVFEKNLISKGFIVNGSGATRISTISNFFVPGTDSEALIMKIRDNASIANGSACTSADIAPSHVLKAMGLSEDDCFASIRCSFSHTTSQKDLAILEKLLIQAKNHIHSFLEL